MPETSIFQNAFQMVRPRGVDRPSAIPAKKGAGKPMTIGNPRVRVLDSNGHLRSSLAPRPHSGFLIEGREQAQASQIKRSKLVKGGL